MFKLGKLTSYLPVVPLDNQLYREEEKLLVKCKRNPIVSVSWNYFSLEPDYHEHYSPYLFKQTPTLNIFTFRDSETELNERVQSYSPENMLNVYDTQDRLSTLHPSSRHPNQYKPDTSFEEGSLSNPYTSPHSIQGGDDKDDEPTFVWIAWW